MAIFERLLIGLRMLKKVIRQSFLYFRDIECMKGFNKSVPKLPTYLDASAAQELMMRADDNRFCTLYLTQFVE